MKTLIALFDLFRKGNAVANPALWKNGGAALQGALVTLILSLASTGKAFGHELPIDETVATAIAGGIAAVVGMLVTYGTSDKVGLPAKPAAHPDVPTFNPADPPAP